jgi:hypothetical protein
MSRPIENDRPRPLVDAASWASRVTGLLGSVVTALAGWGLLTTVQGDAVVGLLGLIPGLVTAGTSVLVAFGVVKRAEPEVTPVIDPMDNQGRALRAVGPAGRV